jgi:hypothetical protein
MSKYVSPGHETERSFRREEQSMKATAPTLISRNGMMRLFSSLESRPSSLAACRKLRLVAASAFMVALRSGKGHAQAAAAERTRLSNSARGRDRQAHATGARDPGEPKTAREKAAFLPP